MRLGVHVRWYAQLVVCVSVCKHLTNLLDKSPWAGYWYALTIAGYAKLTLSPLCFHLVIR